ncbi:Tmemb_161AB domain-containing protein [Cephalotus follicularis]|uniref:Tmemb_161AB domain-containing protein n=1 Tax=Cephalotus follicularis TaxID=3775 RepID=A0A1Q3BX51_CEPFO|nr:Tmemb_161AB domain-containing protein [Cephalotus follicularis]
MPSLIQTYKNLIIQTALSLTLTLILTFLKIPILFLQGLHTYIHPENVGQNNNNHGIRAAIRRPSTSESAADLKRRHKSKDKFEFDENNAQIFRLKLDEGHLQSRLYFNDYRYCFVCSFVGVSSLLLYRFLGVDGGGDDDDSGVLANGSLIPVSLAIVGSCEAFISLVKVSFEKSASKRSEKQLSLIFGALGFVFGLIICFGVVQSVLDFDFGSVSVTVRFFVAAFMGCIVGLLYMPACKTARSFWLGTDQLRCNLGIIYCGWFARMILFGNYLLVVFTALLWINPLADFLVNKHIDDDSNGAKAITSSGYAEQLVGNVGLSPADFSKLRLWCLLLSGLTQIVALRSNLQMYLNEALLSWYQRLHASKVPDLDFSRAKVFLHNHHLCLAALQFFAPPILVLLFVGLHCIDGKRFLVPFYNVFQELSLFMAWSVVFVSAVFTSANLVLYRCGIMYVS